MTTTTDIETIKDIRRSILRMVHNAKVSHIGAAYSMIEILYVLYFKVMNIDPKQPQDPLRDKFVLSKGHGSAGLYAMLAHRGYFSVEDLMTYCINDGKLPGHLDKDAAPGVEVSAGSLGHGLPVALGMALANNRSANPGRIYCIIGDGECNEGSIWESAMLAPSLGLDNFTVIVDFNKIQSFGNTNDIIDQTNMAERWRAFGWDVHEINGHDLEAIEQALRADHKHAKPKAIIAHTVKGQGVSFMEDKLQWHYSSPSDEQLHLALKELE
jgi:transketolase